VESVNRKTFHRKILNEPRTSERGLFFFRIRNSVAPVQRHLFPFVFTKDKRDKTTKKKLQLKIYKSLHYKSPSSNCFLVSHFKSSFFFLFKTTEKNQRHRERETSLSREKEKDWKEEMDTTIRLGHQLSEYTYNRI
jgi:hypothetical protein